MKHWLMQEILINNSSEHNIIQEFVISRDGSVKNEQRMWDAHYIEGELCAVHFATCLTLTTLISRK